MQDDLSQAVMQAAPRAEVRAAVARVYADLQREIDAQKPRCDASGRCCRFEEFGHRLYLTTMELAKFSWDLSMMDDVRAPARMKPTSLNVLAEGRATKAVGIWNGTGCPFQLGNLCGVHRLRPFGCRVYFCDPASTQWQHEAYERLHGQLRRLHDELAVPYRYVEWRWALKTLGIAKFG